MQTQKRSIYEISDPATGEKWQVETEGELTDEDVHNVLRAVGERVSPRVDSVTLTGGKPLAARLDRSTAPKSSALKSRPDALAARFGLDRELPAASGALVRGTEPLARSLRGAILAPFTAAATLGDIGVQAASDVAAGRPVMSTDPKSAGARASDLAFSLVPLRREGAAVFNGTERHPEGGLGAGLDELGQHALQDPFDLALQLMAARGVAKSSAARTLGDVSKAVMTSLDLSAVGRQGLPLAVAHPGRVVPALKDMVTAGLSEPGAQVVAARSRRPMGGQPLQARGLVKPLEPTDPTRVDSEPGALTPKAPEALVPAPRIGSQPATPGFEVSGVEQVKPGVFRASGAALDPTSMPSAPTVAAGPALRRAARGLPGDQPLVAPLVAPAAPEAVLVAPARLGEAPTLRPRPSPEAFGLDLSSSEMFRGSKTLESIPVIGKLFAPGRRAYDGYLQGLRRGAFDDMAAKLEEQGKTPESDPQIYRDAATWVNRLSGSGNAGPIPKPVADLMFAPKLTASRLELLNPRAYLQLAPEVRKVAVRDVLAATGAGLGTLWMASRIPGVKVGTDPEDSATFGKITLADGVTHYDIWGGMLPYARLAALALTGSSKTSAATGKRLESMLAPAPSYALDALRGLTFTGREFDAVGGAVDRFTPLVLQDMREAIQHNGRAGVLTASPSILGVGVQTYPAKKKGGK